MKYISMTQETFEKCQTTGEWPKDSDGHWLAVKVEKRRALTLTHFDMTEAHQTPHVQLAPVPGTERWEVVKQTIYRVNHNTLGRRNHWEGIITEAQKERMIDKYLNWGYQLFDGGGMTVPPHDRPGQGHTYPIG